MSAKFFLTWLSADQAVVPIPFGLGGVSVNLTGSTFSAAVLSSNVTVVSVR